MFCQIERAGSVSLVLLVVSGLSTINECLSHQSMQSFASLHPEIHRLLLIACVCVSVREEEREREFCAPLSRDPSPPGTYVCVCGVCSHERERERGRERGFARLYPDIHCLLLFTCVVHVCVRERERERERDRERERVCTPVSRDPSPPVTSVCVCLCVNVCVCVCVCVCVLVCDCEDLLASIPMSIASCYLCVSERDRERKQKRESVCVVL